MTQCLALAQFLTTVDEDALVSYLIYMAERGFPLTRTMTKAFAWAIAKRSDRQDRFNPETGPGEHWWVNFRKRHPRLALRKADKLERSRAEALSPEIVKEYFELLKALLERNGLMNSPRQLYNCDETFLPLDYTREKVVTLKNTKYVYAQSQGTTDHITVLCAASAAGIPLPPFIIYPKCFPGGQYRFDGPDDALYGKSESGWIDSELFLAWLKKIFLKYVVTQRPVILFTDGHKTHMTLDVIDLCRENGIVLFCLPPHTTHALQPLDVAVFKSLKDHFSKSVRALAFSKPNFVVSKRDFARVFKGPFERAFSITNIKSGFSKSGIFPFNPDAVATAKTVPSALYRSPLSSLSSSPSTPQSSTSSTPCPPSSSESGNASSLIAISPPPTVSSLGGSQDSGMITSTPEQSGAALVSLSTSTPVSFSPIVNPLIAAGLVPLDLADILVTPSEDAAVSKKRTKRITGARELTANEYAEWLKEGDKKKKDAAEEKERKQEERRRKKEEKEEATRRKRAEREAARERKAAEKEEARKRKAAEKEEARKRKAPNRQRKKLESRIRHETGQPPTGTQEKPKARRRLVVETSDSCSESDAPEEHETSSSSEGPSRPKRKRQLPARFRECDSESETEDGALCTICNVREPRDCAAKIVFWIDCEKCGAWVHNFCAFGNNTASRRYICEDCL